ncbi:MAG: NAD(P)H-hydrate dehydratase [Lachnospiraceae bacterium]|nr:NAD(P)H-hydrate dehydratase [Lachnospiraceae bacterium]
MRYLLNSSQMKHVDYYSINNIGIPSMVLMERAALAVADELEGRFDNGKRILVVCGTGNNGADGLAIARIMFQRGYRTDIMLLGDSDMGTEEYRQQLNIIKNMGIHYGNINELSEYIVKGRYDICVDAIFGIGLSRTPMGEYYDAIEYINMSECFVAAVDIPSGISADTGMLYGVAVRADITVTFGYGKLGMTLYPAAQYCGEIIIKDIGFVSINATEQRSNVFTYDKADLCLLPKRNPNTHKGSFGRVLVIAGSEEMSGAAYLSAKAAYRMGAGLVEVLIPQNNAGIIRSLLPEAIVTGYSPEENFIERINTAMTNADVIVTGPGMGTKAYVKDIVSYVMQYSEVPLIIDADALNTMASNRQLLSKLNTRMVVTPHIKEMERLTESKISDIKNNPVDTAKTFSNITGAICVLKDARTVVASKEGDVYINLSGNEGMATGGSGDVLTGIIAGLAAQKLELYRAATLGVYIHGLAGDKAKEQLGSYSLMAGDIIENISRVTSEDLI